MTFRITSAWQMLLASATDPLDLELKQHRNRRQRKTILREQTLDELLCVQPAW